MLIRHGSRLYLHFLVGEAVAKGFPFVCAVGDIALVQFHAGIDDFVEFSASSVFDQVLVRLWLVGLALGTSGIWHRFTHVPSSPHNNRQYAKLNLSLFPKERVRSKVSMLAKFCDDLASGLNLCDLLHT